MMEKVWLKNYPRGIPETVNVDVYSSIVEAFETYSEQFATKYAFNSLGVRLTYGEMNKITRDFAAFLQQHLKLKKSDRFAIMLPNVLQFPLAMFAAIRAGLVVVNVNPLYTAREIAHQLRDAGAKAIIVLENFATELEKALPETQIEHVIVTKVGDCLGSIKGGVVNFVLDHVKNAVPHWNILGVVAYKEALQIGHTLELEQVNIQAEDPAFLQYTGGTTGVAKGAILTHRNIIANVIQSIAWFKSSLEVGKEIIITALPLYHIFSLTVSCFCFMALGSECVLILDPRNMKNFLKILKNTSPTVFIGLNTLFNSLLNQPKFLTLDFSPLKLVVAGGMAMQKSVVNEWKKVTGTVIIEGYGLTEASPVVSINPVTIKNYNGSIGLPIPSTDVSIQDETGNELSLGKVGELCVKGPQVMQGYWNQPEETAIAIDQQGWLRTGDIAKIDERGFIYLLDRKKDMILVSGFNVFPNEVEDIIASHPGVKEVAVVGVPSEKSGESVKAFIVKKDEHVTANDIIVYCRERLTGYKIPRSIEFCNDLPKSNVGKILRRELRKPIHDA